MKKIALCLAVFCLAGSTYGQDSTKVSSKDLASLQQANKRLLNENIELEASWKHWHYEWLKYQEMLNQLKGEFRLFIQSPEIATVLDTVLPRIILAEERNGSNLWLWVRQLRAPSTQQSQR